MLAKRSKGGALLLVIDGPHDACEALVTQGTGLGVTSQQRDTVGAPQGEDGGAVIVEADTVRRRQAVRGSVEGRPRLVVTLW